MKYFLIWCNNNVLWSMCKPSLWQRPTTSVPFYIMCFRFEEKKTFFKGKMVDFPINIIIIVYSYEQQQARKANSQQYIRVHLVKGRKTILSSRNSCLVICIAVIQKTVSRRLSFPTSISITGSHYYRWLDRH